MPGILQMLLARGSSGGTSYTLQQSATDASQVGSAVGDTSAKTYIGHSVAISAATFVCTKVTLIMGRVGTGTPLLTGYVWADNAGAPGTLLATSTNTVDGTALVTTGSAADFIFSGVTLTNGVTYWFGASASAIDLSNYNTLRCGASSTGAQYRSQNGTTWSNTGITRIGATYLYSSP
jgi:hypothetical protein